MTGGPYNDLNAAVVTNNGTLTWSSGTIRGGSGATIYNYGLWDAQSDQSFNNAYGGAAMTFNNYGTLPQIGRGQRVCQCHDISEWSGVQPTAPG